ncbi:MBL fold metallo-hydrolase [Photobacterium sanctipauli]|uniref:MBL fold metallo-hydrolase n=1 Tax=Photobacterium sanctipauli TaxID=1342794 RepID=A0A2T3NZ39_9GAMM|nr:MBL fold metallo-hydrolase [Photobacterium sanctipauli]
MTLGTKGGPSLLTSKRLAHSNVLMVGDDAYLIDAGYGASLRLLEAGIPLKKIKGIFLTHLHSDHTLDYPALLVNAWSTGLKTPIKVYGPKGIEQMHESALKTYQIDIDQRIDFENRPDLYKLIEINEMKEGEVFDNGTLKVSSIAVPHSPFEMGEAFALKFEVGGKMIVSSGDVSYYPPLGDFAKNADILLHEVVYPQGVANLVNRINGSGGEDIAKAILIHHTSARDVGKIAQKAQPTKLVLTHLIPADDPDITDQTWIDMVNKEYQGDVVVAKDGMEFLLD